MNYVRGRIFRIAVVAATVAIIARLFYLQIIDTRYKAFSDNNVLRYEVQFPPRGEVYDRNGEFLVQSKESYDLLAVPREVKPFDTVLLARILEVSEESLAKELRKARNYSPRKPSVIYKLLSKEIKLKFDERNFPGFYTQYRTVRFYPKQVAGNLLGYVGEVNDNTIKRNPYYRPGDYIGISGVEQAFEEVLRGQKGVKIEMVDVHGMPKGSYEGGIYDTLATPGSAITCTIDLRLQALAEELLQGKVGSVVAIEPSTGEILAMANSPSYDPDQLVGRERGNNYMKLLGNPRHPLFNRAVMSRYPPGSTFKLVNGLIGLQEGTLVPSNSYPCYGGYKIGRGVACHAHASPLELSGAIQTSCNAYFCYVYRNLVDSKKYGGVKEGFDVWYDYVRSFGFGRKLDSDFTNELDGYIPTREFYDKRYRGSWNSLTTVSLAIGQGEIGTTPLQMANFIATIANRGYYYIPHVVKAIEGRDSIDARFYEKHYSKVDKKHFDVVANAMWKAVNVSGTALAARVEGLNVCGKTGTAQNPQGRDHSTFACFAPLDDPKIAILAYVEHGGFGATVAVPLSRLLVEQYLTGKISNPSEIQRIKSMFISYPSYDR